MTDPWLKLGGCAALTAMDNMIYFTLFCGKKKLCPIDVRRLNKDSYNQFASEMKPYLSPRFSGVPKLELFTEGAGKYLEDRGCNDVTMKEFHTGQPLEQAEQVLIQQIDNKMPIPFLLLTPVSEEWKDYSWHWFMLTGYRQDEDGLMVRAVTYGEEKWLPFAKLWDCENAENGGMILYEFT